MNETLAPVRILLVEDNPGDVELAREALESSKLKVDLTVAGDGAQALALMEALDGKGRLPQLIFLDLNMPGIPGSEVLKRVKSQPKWGRIPIVVLTSSQAEEDIAKSYDLHANCYVTKPIDFNKFITVVNTIEQFWFTIVTLPRTT